MNELGLSLVWLALQITVLCVIAVPIYFVARRNSPSGGATATFSVLMLVAALSAAALSPWPRWSFAEAVATTARTSGLPASGGIHDDDSIPSGGGRTVAVATTDSGVTRDANLISLTERLQIFRETFVEQLGQGTSRTDSGLTWSGWLAVAFCTGAGVAVLRLLLGLVAVRAQRRRSQPVTHAEMLGLLDVLCAEFTCRRSVELRESSEIVSAATIGWRRPVILLPAEWSAWTDAERRSVMAHEIAHISQNDFLCWLCAQLGLLLHFYHPLVHWLANRLRLEQELAADALAAEHSGGAKPYLKTLAELALRQADRPVAWPARTFLPTKGTLTRRVEMLRDSGFKPLSLMASRWRRGIVVCTLLGATGLLSGIRPPAGMETTSVASAQDVGVPPGDDIQLAQNSAKGDAAETAPEPKPFDLRYVPPTATMLFGIKPDEVAGVPMFRPLIPMIEQGMPPTVRKTKLKLNQFSQVLMVAYPAAAAGGSPFGQPVFIVTAKESAAADGLLELMGQDQEFTEATHNGRKLNVTLRGQAAYRPDDTTIVYGSRGMVEFLIDVTRIPVVGKPLWHREFATIADQQLVYLVDMNAARPFIQKQLNSGGPNGSAASVFGMTQAIAPLWKDTTVLATGMSFDQVSSAGLTMWCDGNDAGERVEQTLQSLIPLGRNMLGGAKESLRTAPPETQGAISTMIAFVEQLLDEVKIERDGNKVSAITKTQEGSVPVMIGLLLPAIQSARMAARRTQSMNNLKVIMLALHNYHDTYGHMPPAILTGDDGKTTHSWRVAILPFLGEAELHNRYNFKEPWNSPGNLKVAQNMPAIFRHPNQPAGSTNTSYAGLIGEHTGLGNGTESVKFRDIRDGSSNTIMLVETRQPIPWTSPVDLKYSAEDELPQLGGYTPNVFMAGLADGSVKVIATNATEMIRAMTTRDGGETIPPEASRPAPAGGNLIPVDRPIRK